MKVKLISLTLLLASVVIPIPSAKASAIVASQAFGVYIDAPYVQGSYLSNSTLYPGMTVTDNYDGTGAADNGTCPTTNVGGIGNVGTYSFPGGAGDSCRIIKNSHGNGSANSYVYGGALTTSETATTGTSATQSDSPGIYNSSGTTITFSQPKNYIGFWWSAGSSGNAVKVYQNNALVLTLTVDDVCTLVGDASCHSTSGSVTALDSTTTYTKGNYFGHPRNTSGMDSNEPFTYVHIFAQNSITFTKVNFSTTGNGFEYDNLTVGNLTGSALTPKTSLVAVASYGNTYSLGYNSQGGSSIDTQTTVSGGNVAVTSSVPTRTGYSFSSWNSAANGGGTNYSANATYPSSGTISGDATLFAKWTANSIPISFDSNTATSGSMSSLTTVADSAIAITSNSFSKTGFTFSGWSTTASGSVSYSNNSNISVVETTTLYAIWSANTLAITYNSQGGSAISSGTTASSGSISASPGSPTRSGYTFAGWFTSSSGGSAISFPYSHGQTSDFTLYAQWNAVPAPAPAPVPVGPPPPSKVQPPVTISVSKTEIEFGQTLQIDLSGGISGSGTTYSVSGTGLCSINSSGVITALKEGSCTITATKSSNADYKAADSNSITITVKPLQAIQNFGVSQPVPAGSTVIVIPKDNSTPVAVSTPKSSTSSTTTSKSSTTTADRKVEVSQTPEKTVIQISPNQIQLSAKSGTNNSDILLSGLVKGLKIKATVVMLNGLTKTSTPATPAEVNKIINSNPNSKVNIEITPTINQDLKKSAQIAVDGAKKNQRVKVTVK